MPDMTEDVRKTDVADVAHAMRVYCLRAGVKLDLHDPREDIAEFVADLICNLRHFCDVHYVDFVTADDHGRQYYEADLDIYRWQLQEARPATNGGETC